MSEVRLIDANELKRAFEKVYPLATNEMGSVVNKQIYDIIDNAPTVEPFEPDYVGKERLEARQRGYEEGYRNGMEIGKTLNPKIKQGEWIEHWSEDLQKMGFRQCSKCKAGYQLYEHGTRKSDLPWIDGQQYTLQNIGNFCPNCGAKMKGSAECMDEDAKQASIPYTYNAPQHDWKCGYPSNNSCWWDGYNTAKTLFERPQGETNSEIFKQTFGIYATELWSMKEADFLKWLNAEQD